MPLLSIQNLSVDFVAEQGTTHALQQISYDVNKGELVAVVGESGSGKSVTALSVLQLLPAPPAKYVQGKIIFTEGELQTNLLQASRAAMQTMRGNKIAMIFQEPMTSLNPVMRCGTQVAEALKIHNDMSNAAAKEKTIALFQQVQLPNPAAMYNRYPHEISGGQKQRVMIAMAMSCEPQLLICDEPTTALDVTVQKNILQLIKQLQQQNNMGVIFISHDLGVVAEIADTIIVMYKGMIMEKGKAKDILQHPKHPYTKALLACRPALHGKKESLPTVSDFMEVNESGAIIEKEWKPMPAVVSEQKNEMGNTAIPPLLQVEHLNVWYPAHTNFLSKVTNYVKAVNDVSFHIANGETLGLVGESGCGKTTLGRAVLGLLAATSGKIIFDNNDITKCSSKELKSLRKKMQIIFQDPYSSLNPSKKIGDAIAEVLLVHRIGNSTNERKEKVMSLLQKVDLKREHYDRYPHQFSGGQRQRIVIARALALEPQFVVCDESVSALDVSVQAQVLNLLNELKAAFGFTALFISHDLSVIRYISNRIMVMNKGCIEEIGEAEELYHHPKSEYTKQLIAAIPGVRI